MGEFLRGLFTRHVGTKVLSLLLAVVLFAVVQQSLEETAGIEELVLQFRLAPDVEQTYVLLTPQVVLRDVRLRGTRSKVTPLRLEFQRQKTLNLEVSARFLERHGNERTIVVDNDFCHAHGILDPAVALLLDAPGQLRLDHRMETSLTPTFAEGMRPRVVLPEESDLEGTLKNPRELDVRFSESPVRLRGPARAFLPEAQNLYVKFPDIHTWLRGKYVAGKGTYEMELDEIDWRASKVEGAFLTHMEANLGGRWVPAADLVRLLRLRFDVRPRKVAVDLKPAIVYHVGAQEGPPDLEKFMLTGPEGPIYFQQQDLDNGACARFAVEVSATLRGSPDLAEIVVVLDLANAREEGERLLVPIRLDTRDPTRRELLREVRMQLEPDYVDKEPVLVFRVRP